MSKSYLWLKKGAEAGDPLSQLAIGEIYLRGADFVQKDYTKALFWLRESAKQKNINAVFLLGLMLHEGWGVSKNYNQAYILLKHAAKHGHEKASIYLSGMYFEGRGVTRDYLRAYAWANIATSYGENLKPVMDFLDAQMPVSFMLEAQGLSREIQETIKNNRAKMNDVLP